MKLQDILFIIVFLLLLWKRNPGWLLIGGIACLLGAIPLFALHVFFTAERLVYYAFFLLFACILLLLFKKRDS